MLTLLIAAALSTATGEAAVRAAEDGWSAAYVTGDTAFLERLLADDYVSVGQTGESHPKPAIVAGAAKYAAAHPGSTATPMPPSSTIAISGDVALVRHHGATDTSVDVFQKRGDAWIALYSQHTAIKAP